MGNITKSFEVYSVDAREKDPPRCKPKTVKAVQRAVSPDCRVKVVFRESRKVIAERWYSGSEFLQDAFIRYQLRLDMSNIAMAHFYGM